VEPPVARLAPAVVSHCRLIRFGARSECPVAQTWVADGEAFLPVPRLPVAEPLSADDEHEQVGRYAAWSARFAASRSISPFVRSTITSRSAMS
jgi:hypothetical protein